VNEAQLDTLTLVLVEVLRSQFVVGLPSGQQVIDGDEDRVPNGHDCPSFASACGAAAVLCREGGALHPAHHGGDLG
jgi:hypothetical protein